MTQRWASAVAQRDAFADALDDAVEEIESVVSGADANLVVAFVSPAYGPYMERIPELLAERFPSAVAFGCSAGGVIGGGREVERKPALSLTAAHLPGANVRPIRFGPAELPELGAQVAAPAVDDSIGAASKGLLLLPDPFSCDANALIDALDAAYPDVPKIGGLASGGRQPGETALFLGDRTHRSGAVALSLEGDVTVETLVAQGCRPIGPPMFATRCDQNVVRELDGQPATHALRDVFGALTPEDQLLMRQALFVGVVMRPEQTEYKHGDFLIRNVLGMDAKSGSLAVGAHIEPNAVVQLHVRDARDLAQDLGDLLAARRASAGPAGALLFSCLGRGEHLYGEPDHDSRLFTEHVGAVPLGGFFCNGEIGPVLGRTFVHGYTSSFALFS